MYIGLAHYSYSSVSRVGSWILLASLAVAFSSLQAQQTENVRLTAVLEQVDSTWKTAPSDAVALIDRTMLEILNPDSSQYIEALRYKGRAHRLLGEYVTALDEWTFIHEYASARKDSLMVVEAAKQIGAMKGYMGNYLEAQPYLLQVAEIQDKIGTVSQQASAMNGLAIMYKDMEREEDAIKMYHKALDLFTSVNDTMGRAAINANLGLLHTERGEFELAEEHLKEQGRLHGMAESNYGLAFYYEFLGILRQKQGRPAEALPLADKSLALREALPSHYNIAESRLTVAGILLDLRRYTEAASLAEKVLDFKEDHQSLTQESKAYEILSEAYEGQGKAGAALDYYKDFKKISDSIYRRDHLKEITSRSALYEKAKQDEEIAQLGRLNAISEADNHRKDVALLAAGFGILILTLTALVVWRLFRKISRQKAALQVLHNQKDTLLREIHHRVKNNLQMISSLLSLQSEYIEDDIALEAMKMGQSRVRSMAIIHQKLYMRDEAITAVSAGDYLEQLIGELMATLNVRGLNLRLTKDLQDIALDIDRMIALGLVANEVITNAMKYAFVGREAGELQVIFKRSGADIVLVIADDGVGLDEKFLTDTDNFGSLLIQTFTEQLEGKLVVDGSDGTSVSLRFPA